MQAEEDERMSDAETSTDVDWILLKELARTFTHAMAHCEAVAYAIANELGIDLSVNKGG